MTAEIGFRILTLFLTISVGILVHRFLHVQEMRSVAEDIGDPETTQAAAVEAYSELRAPLINIPESAKRDYSNLRPSNLFWDHFEEDPKPEVSIIKGNRRLVSIGDAVYMLDAENRVLWFWTSEGPPLTDHPVVDNQDRVFIVAYDLIWRSLDATDGSRRWRNTGCGRSVYSQIEPFKGDMYLVVTDLEGYRYEATPSKDDYDYVTLMKDDLYLWSTKIAPGAKIRVKGEKVFVFSGQGKRESEVRIHIPPSSEFENQKIGIREDLEE